MRIINIFAAVALALACGASAAVASIPTSEGLRIVVERPDIAEREAAPAPTPHGLPPPPTSFAGPEFPGPTGFGPPALVAPTTFSIPIDDKLLVRGEEAAGFTAQLESPAHKPPHKSIGSVIASYAHSIACKKGGLFDAFCKGGHRMPRRDEVPQRPASKTIYEATTIVTTSTIASTTITITQTTSPISSDTSIGWWGAAHIAMQTVTMSSTITNPTGGVSIVYTTVQQTVTVNPSTLTATTYHESTTCSNNTSIDTQTYLNISTFSMTDITLSPSSNSSTIAPFFTQGSNLTTADTSKLVTTSTTTRAASTPNAQSSATVTLGSAAGMSTIDLASLHLPTTMLVAMAACFVLALFL